jgi:DNA-binding NtrC family response regulator
MEKRNMTDNATVLVVDDESAICKLINDILEPEGYTCEMASRADLALEVLSRHPVDLVLLDIKMPGMSGMDLLDIIVKSCSSVPVIICTAVTDVNIAIEAMKKGAVDYILKPFTIDDVINRVEAICSKKKSAALTGYQSIELKSKSLPGRLDAIARGVEALVDHFDYHDRIVIERTIEVARQLAIPQADIDAWTTARQQRSSPINKKINLAAGIYERSARTALATPPPGV